MLHSGQCRCWLNFCCSPSGKCTTTRPCPKRNPCSSESSKRARRSACTTIRSTSTSMGVPASGSGASASRRTTCSATSSRVNPSGCNAFHALDLGFVHTLQELPRVGRKPLHVAPLSFGVQRVKRQTRFARATHASDDDEFVQGQVQ